MATSVMPMPSPTGMKAAPSSRGSGASAATSTARSSMSEPARSTVRLLHREMSLPLQSSAARLERPRQSSSRPICASFAPVCSLSAGIREVSMP